jgi:hypothetical protein
MKQESSFSSPLPCYFFGISFDGEGIEKNGGLFGFAIPDLGISFRSRSAGTLFECQYEGLLALLKFIEENREAFKDTEIEAFSDSAIVNYQINHHRFISPDLRKYYNAAIRYRTRIKYKVSWIPRHENVSFAGLFDMPPVAADIRIDFDKKNLDGNRLEGDRDSDIQG